MGIVVSDVDGVIANPYNEVNHQLEKMGHKTKPWTEWTDFYTDVTYPDIPKKDIRPLYRNPIVMKNAVPFEESWYWANHVSSVHSLHFLTARIEKFLGRTTRDWFLDWDIQYDDIHFSDKKVEVLRTLDDVVAFVEDKPVNAALAAEAGFKSYLINRPYNINDGDSGDAIRVDSLWEIPL